jgi:hypothetical protein
MDEKVRFRVNAFRSHWEAHHFLQIPCESLLQRILHHRQVHPFTTASQKVELLWKHLQNTHMLKSRYWQPYVQAQSSARSVYQ